MPANQYLPLILEHSCIRLFSFQLFLIMVTTTAVLCRPSLRTNFGKNSQVRSYGSSHPFYSLTRYYPTLKNLMWRWYYSTVHGRVAMWYYPTMYSHLMRLHHSTLNNKMGMWHYYPYGKENLLLSLKPFHHCPLDKLHK